MTQRPHVLFVDDEPMIIDGLRRMLRICRDRWTMSFAESGAAALDIMRSRPCDVVVTDYRMPEMDGAALLEQVRTEFPSMVRVILSGQTNESNLLRIMVLAHEMLSKPTTPEALIAVIERLLEARLRTGSGQQNAVAFVESLPSPPHTFAELLAALEAEEASAQSVSVVIEKDPAATAKVLHVVNSSAYTAGHKVSDVAQAVTLLGLHTVRGLVMMHDLIRVFDTGGALPPTWIERLTTHAVETSRLARLLGAGTDWQSHAFTAGLLHEVGQLVLASARPAVFRKVFRRLEVRRRWPGQLRTRRLRYLTSPGGSEPARPLGTPDRRDRRGRRSHDGSGVRLAHGSRLRGVPGPPHHGGRS